MVEHGQISYETPHFVELVGADDTWVRPYAELFIKGGRT